MTLLLAMALAWADPHTPEETETTEKADVYLAVAVIRALEIRAKEHPDRLACAQEARPEVERLEKLVTTLLDERDAGKGRARKAHYDERIAKATELAWSEVAAATLCGDTMLLVERPDNALDDDDDDELPEPPPDPMKPVLGEGY